MKTPRHSDRLDNQNQIVSGREVRRKRTLTAFTCESLEGRKLMTGFAGASAAMVGHGPADMADMDGGRFDHGDRFRAIDGMTDDSGTSTSASSSQTSGDTATSDASDAQVGSRMDMRSFHGMDDSDSQGTDDSGMMGHRGFKSDRMDAGATSDSAGGGMSGKFAGGGMGDSDDGGGRFDVPMANGYSSQDGDGGTTGNTQLDTDITKLQTDEQAIHDKSQVTPALQASVRKDFEAIDKAKTGTADATALKTLQTDEQTIFAGNTAPTDAQQTQLQTDRNAVLVSQGVSQTLIDQLAADQLAVKTASNFTDADKATLDADHAAIDKDRTAADTTTTDGSAAASASTPSTTAATATTATTSAIPDATPAVAAAATSDPAAAAMPTTDPASQTAAPTPDQAAPAAAAAAAPAPMTSGGVDPTATQTTTTAMPSLPTDGAMGHHGRHGMEMGMDHAEFSHHSMTTEGVQHDFEGGGHSRRDARG